ncbi:hypothetical protein [Microbaculum sp. FT89]|uniref:hypothetical protein n=1 Tax=Microbaculum sp. FT89 TaxID=3447298 RepID=UPI003F53689C
MKYVEITRASTLRPLVETLNGDTTFGFFAAWSIQPAAFSLFATNGLQLRLHSESAGSDRRLLRSLGARPTRTIEQPRRFRAT